MISYRSHHKTGGLILTTKQNLVRIGQKTQLVYVLAAQTLAQNNDDVMLRARGTSINKAVDVAEIILDKERDFMKDWKLSTINIGTDIKPATETSKTNKVSYIEIILSKK